MKIKLVSIEELIVLPLILNVFSDGFFVHADRGDEVSPAPETLLSESTLSCESVVYSDSTLALEEPHDIRNGMFGWNSENHMHVIGAGIAFEYFDLFLLREFADNLADLNSHWTIQDFFAVLGYDDHVVLAIPDHVIL